MGKLNPTKRDICQTSWAMLDDGVDDASIMEYLETCGYRPLPGSLAEARLSGFLDPWTTAIGRGQPQLVGHASQHHGRLQDGPQDGPYSFWFKLVGPSPRSPFSKYV